MFRRRRPKVQIGDCFTKVGGNGKVWTVTGMFDTHAQLASTQRFAESITISVSALGDRSLFQPFTPEPVDD